ncbi:hypothetical protein [Roseibium sp. RKSG952]|uniref:hypothetical protein n=1 Tax=Roseibium sp. RKSG952 TaxID=2529384 RepID=UPI0012BBC7DE|nr:hypothetical protein [Roseibium sp. RKSG952]MTH95299.1 hypothetical protein [Roseibium sp. RKSG952]
MSQKQQNEEVSSQKRSLSSRLGSAVGEVTGGSVVSRSVRHISGTIGGSSNRLGGMVSDLLNDDLASPSLGQGGTDEQRFAAAMRLHRVTEKSLNDRIRNTKRNFNLYFVVFAISVLAGLFSIFIFPPASAFSVIIRFIATPILLALVFKHAYTNWMFRKRRLSSPLAYFSSGDLWPKMP